MNEAIKYYGTLLLVTALLFIGGICTSNAASLSVADDQVYLEGELVGGEAEVLLAYNETAEVKPTTLVINGSNGGNIVAAAQLGRAIRSLGMSTRNLGMCVSACVYVQAGGVVRSMEPHAVFMLHRVTPDVKGLGDADPVKTTQLGILYLWEYCEEMGVDAGVLKTSLNHPNNVSNFAYLGPLSARAFGLVND